MRRLLATVAILALLLSAGLSPVLAQSETSTPETAENARASDGPSLAELKRGGELIGDPASLRMGERRMFWVIHWPALEIGSDPGEDQRWSHLEPGARVDRNRVYLRTYAFDAETVHVKIASWERATRTVKEGNTTRSEPVARNVSVRTQEVTLERGRPTAPIVLEQHDRPVQMTMWIEEYPFARWRFSHKSIATTQSAGISSEGDYLYRVFLELVLPMLGGALALWFIVNRAIEKAKVGPMRGPIFWTLVLGGLALIGYIGWFDSITELLVAAPRVIAVGVVSIFGIVMLESLTSGVEKVRFIQLDVSPATSPSGEETVDTRHIRSRTERLIETSDGTAIVRPGVIPFLARLRGGLSRLRNTEEIRTEIKDTGPSSESRAVLVHPDADEVIDYAREGFRLSFFRPDPDPVSDGERSLDRSAATKTAIATVFGSFLAGSLFAGPFPSDAGTVSVLTSVFFHPVAVATAAIAFAWVGLEARDAESWVTPAPAHLTSAFASSSVLAEETELGETIEDYAEENRTLKIRRQKEIERRISEGDRTLIEEMHDMNPEEREQTEQESGFSFDGPDERPSSPRNGHSERREESEVRDD